MYILAALSSEKIVQSFANDGKEARSKGYTTVRYVLLRQQKNGSREQNLKFRGLFFALQGAKAQVTQSFQMTRTEDRPGQSEEDLISNLFSKALCQKQDSGYAPTQSSVQRLRQSHADIQSAEPNIQKGEVPSGSPHCSIPPIAEQEVSIPARSAGYTASATSQTRSPGHDFPTPTRAARCSITVGRPDVLASGSASPFPQSSILTAWCAKRNFCTRKISPGFPALHQISE